MILVARLSFHSQLRDDAAPDENIPALILRLRQEFVV